MFTKIDFTIPALRRLYQEGHATVADVVEEALRRAADPAHPNVWITLFERAQILAYVERLDPTRRAELPLYGLPFAIKDNIDLAGVPTTAGCPGFAFTPERSATVVERLLAAGAIPIGKTNMDQFATGLVGIRSPYGACASVFDSRFISGGSSSGSAVAVAAGMVSFSLGTDTAGSGRVPAAFNQIVGLKPSCGLLSTQGVFPACRSLDCVSIFAGSSADAATILDVAAALDPADAYSRQSPPVPLPAAPRIGVLRREHREFFGDNAAETLYQEALNRIEQMGGTRVEIDFTPFRETAALLYQGPWVAERRLAVGQFLDTQGQAMDSTVRSIISGADRYTAVDTFAALYKLKSLTARTKAEWAKMDAILLPTTGTIYRHQEVEAQPVTLNTNLGYYTNFVNLLDLAAVAVPAGKRPNGLPFGVTLMAPAFCDKALLVLADRFHKAAGGEIGITGTSISEQPPAAAPLPKTVRLAVVGAHLSGQPLNWQLTSRSATLLQTTRTAAHYRLYALANTTPPKPGLVRCEEAAGDGIELEIWSLSEEAFGSFVSEVPPPMVIGTVLLADGTSVKGFLCEPAALAHSPDITHTGGWRGFLGADGRKNG